MKMENRTGVVYKMTGKRRNPWVAKVYVGKVVDDESKKVKYRYKAIGYFPRKTDAYRALLAYKEKPSEASAIPLSRVYEEWSAIHYKTISESMVAQYKNSWRHFASLHDADIRTLKTSDIESAIALDDPARTIRANMKILLSALYKYALAHEYCVKDYAELVNFQIDKKTELVRKVFTPDEVEELFRKHDVISDALLVAIYSGMRPNEVCDLTVNDIDGMFFRIPGSKTKNGLYRDCPVHMDILTVIERNRLKAAKFRTTRLFVRDSGSPLPYTALYRWMRNHSTHLPHDTRHSFITYAKRSNMDDVAVKRIVGHESGRDVTSDVYTHLDDAFLTREMRKFTIA